MKEYTDNQNIAIYIVDAFWQHSETIKSYEEIVEWITETEELTDEDQLNLLKLLNASIKKLKSTISSSSKKKKTKNNDEDENSEKDNEIIQMTSYLASVLPQILTKFQSDKEKIEELLEIIQHLKLNVYISNNLQHVKYLFII
jgi:cohesin complex subunit SA-1/2